MGFILENIWLELLAVGLVLWAAFYYWATLTYSYWDKRGVKTVKKLTPLFGSIADTFLLRTQLGIHFQNFYNEMPGERFCGYYKLREPAIMLRDPELVKHILVKDFHSFHDNDIHINEQNDPMLAYNIFSIHGPRWKYLRTRLTPAFSTGKIKQMFPLMMEVCSELKKHIQRTIDSKAKSVETKHMSANYTTDMVGSCAFGVKCNSLEDENNTFRQMGKDLIDVGPVRGLVLMIVIFSPKFGDIFKLKFVSDRLANFFRKMVKDAMEYREKNSITRNDFIQLLMQLKKKGELEAEANDKSEKTDDSSDSNYNADDGKIEFTHDVLTAQALAFFADGFETSSTALGFAIFEIAMNSDVQDKLREEVDTVLDNFGGKLSYEALQEMHYMDQVLAETLRKYPPAMTLNRLCTKNYQMPSSELKIETGTILTVPVYALHHDPQYWPEPDRFDPERFTDENKKNITPYTYMPFGEGPRICIGMRFANAQMKAALATIMQNFEIKATGETEYPVEFDPNFFLIHPKNGLKVQFLARE